MPEPTQKGREVIGRLEQRRRNITDVIVTAVILGLTLNILSDYIMSFDAYSEDMLWGKSVLAAVSIFVTILLLTYLVLRDMEDMSRTSMERTIHLFWNIDTGQPIPTTDAFWIQDRFHHAFNDWVTDLAKESTIDALRKDLIPKERRSYLTPEQSNVLIPHFNFALFVALLSSSGRSDYGISETETIPMSQILDVPELKYDLLTNAILELPGHVRFDRKSEENQQVIEFQWHKGYSGRLKITSAPKKLGIVYRFINDLDGFGVWEVGGLKEILDTKAASRTAFATFSVTFEGIFSRMRLYLNIEHTNELRVWIADFLSVIGDTLNR